jgi:glycogen operon protein
MSTIKTDVMPVRAPIDISARQGLQSSRAPMGACGASIAICWYGTMPRACVFSVTCEILKMNRCVVRQGASAPLGATVYPGGVNFSVFSKNATSMELLLFDDESSAEPVTVIPLDPQRNRTYHYWHVFVPSLKLGQVYGYRAHGPFAPERGLRFDGDKFLLDPYGFAVAVPQDYDRDAARRPGDNAAGAMKSVVADPSRYDWEGDLPLRRPFTETVIYELHVRGFTRHASSGVAPGKRGTYAGLIEKIPYLKDLGVTAVELLPVFQFDPQDAPQGRVN